MSKKATNFQPEAAPASLKIKAFLTDSFMILMPIMYGVAYGIMGSLQNFSAHKAQGWLYIALPYFLVTFLFLYIKGETPGYRAYGLKLYSNNGTNPSVLQVIVRIVWAMAIAVTLLGWLFIFVRKDSKHIHDLFSFTTVVYTQK